MSTQDALRSRTGEDRNMKVNNAVKGAAATGGLALAACAVCCAPLIAAPVLGLLAAGGIGLAVAGQVGIALLLGAGVAGYVWYRRGQRKLTAASSCGCGPATSCKAGDMPANSS
jgi:hypothetical protein